MDEQRKKKIDKTVFRVSLLPLIAAVIYMLYSAFIRKSLGFDYYVVLSLGLGLHWLLSDVVSIVLSKGFEGKTEAQIKAYRLYALLNLVGFAGLGYFACSVGNNNGIIGALIYVVTLSVKRKYLEEYKGITTEEDSSEEVEELSDGEDSSEEVEELSDGEDSSEEVKELSDGEDLSEEAEKMSDEGDSWEELSDGEDVSDEVFSKEEE